MIVLIIGPIAVVYLIVSAEGEQCTLGGLNCWLWSIPPIALQQVVNPMLPQSLRRLVSPLSDQSDRRQWTSRSRINLENVGVIRPLLNNLLPAFALGRNVFSN